jgi:hypothetical protein
LMHATANTHPSRTHVRQQLECLFAVLACI